MSLDRLTLTHFRNHRETRLEGTARFNLLVGENGAGKTNVLEAISLFAPGRGLRRAALPDMAAKQASGGFAVSGEILEGAVRLGTGTEAAKPTRRLVQVNGADTAANALSEWLAISWLTPAMDRLFAEGPGARRRWLDRLVLALEPGHARNSARFDNALRERNRLLAEPVEPEAAWFAALEVQIAEAGALIAQARERLVAQLSAALASLPDAPPDAPFARPALLYAAGGPTDAAQLAQALADHRRRDRAAQRSLIGPHRDELVVTMAGKDQAAAECSTGEQKAMLIALTLAHAGLLPRERPGLLLLDEVAAHLDPLRRDALFARLRDSGAQVWLTGTELAPFAAITSEAAVWRVQDGAVERLS